MPDATPAFAQPRFAPLPALERWLVFGLVGAVMLVSWGWMLHMAWAMDDLMRGGLSDAWMPPAAGPWSPYDLWMLFAMWAIMMVAMMTPAALPMLKMYRTLQLNRQKQGQEQASWVVLLTGYLLTWTFYSALISVVQYPLHQWGLLDPMMDSRSYLFSGSLLIVAGLYQWTPWKDACLQRCRTPLQFLMAHWRNGYDGALRMGLDHGLYCIGCCWALMLMLFAVGMMNILWVAALTVFVIIEKVLPGPSLWFRSITGGLFLIAGTVFLYLHTGPNG